MENQNALSALDAELPVLKKIMAFHVGNSIDVETLVRSEIDYLAQIAHTKPEILNCEPVTVVHAIKNVLRKNLSLDPSLGLVYVKTRNVNTGTQAAPRWKTSLEIQETVDGLVSFARQCGRILDIMRPDVTISNGKVISVTVRMLVPSHPAPRWEAITFDQSDFKRWQLASHNERGRGKQDANKETLNYANRLYTSEGAGIDREFARAKAIRHALKKKGTNPMEGRAGKPVHTIEIPHKQIVEKSADIAALEDETFAAKIEHASVVEEPQQDPGRVDASSELPDAKDL